MNSQTDQLAMRMLVIRETPVIMGKAPIIKWYELMCSGSVLQKWTDTFDKGSSAIYSREWVTELQKLMEYDMPYNGGGATMKAFEDKLRGQT